jgi:hypothetical protein
MYSSRANTAAAGSTILLVTALDDSFLVPSLMVGLAALMASILRFHAKRGNPFCRIKFNMTHCADCGSFDSDNITFSLL